ncbi:MAG: hypothetical protein HY657_02915 [Acidobacteria bacterium]|nr:hypothetical protein [Acidobacteriota bacterium]
MRPRVLIASISLLVVIPLLGAAQQGGRGAGPAGQGAGGGGNVLGRGAPPLAPDTRPFDPRDLSGVWLGNQYGFNATYEPPMTPEGRKKFDAQMPAYGARIGTPAAQNASVPRGRRRARPPAQGNDYVGACNPLGLVRLLLYDPAPMEMITVPNRIIQRFEWTWDHREIWVDGRPLPDVDAYLPRWTGYSAGRWGGNTLVVTTVGLDDRQWLDHFGYPISDQARLEERWTRTYYNIMELRMTVTDPRIYTEPWNSDLVTFRLAEATDLAAGTGWASLVEDKCVPFDEVEQYNRNVRNPAGGVPGVDNQAK